MSQEYLLEALASFHKARVLVLGDVMLDRYMYGVVERTSPEAPVPVMALQRTSSAPGDAANVARNVAALGANTVLLGVAGQDEAGTELRSQLSAMARIHERLLIDSSRPTTTKTRYVADRQQMLRTDVESSAALSPQLILELLCRYEAALEQTDVVVLSDYGKGVLSEQVTALAIAAATARRKLLLVDLKSRSIAKYRGGMILIPNKQELHAACVH